jgi:uncharacterized membrane protein
MEWMTILIRWGHVMAGIAWVGTSFYFNWFDLSVRRPNETVIKKNVRGTLHEIHGGSFYYHEQYWPDTDPPRMLGHAGPAQLTFLTGMALIAILYWYGASIYLIDSQIRALSEAHAIMISVVSFLIVWPLYHKLCKATQNDLAVFLWVSALTVVAALFFSNIFGGRAAFLHVGALLGTIMALNVHFVIVPNHIEMRKQIRDGVPLDRSLGEKAKRVSQHNNYFTLPVVFAMLSTHFPLAYGHTLGWLVLSLIMGFGVALRHYRNIQLKSEKKDRRFLLMAAALLCAAIATSQVPATPTEGRQEAVSNQADSEILSIVQSRCTSCHSANPTSEDFTTAPLGFKLDSLAQVRLGASKILQRAVHSKDMPINNMTGMTNEEREALGNWLSAIQSKSGTPAQQ